MVNLKSRQLTATVFITALFLASLSFVGHRFLIRSAGSHNQSVCPSVRPGITVSDLGHIFKGEVLMNVVGPATYNYYKGNVTAEVDEGKDRVLALWCEGEGGKPAWSLPGAFPFPANNALQSAAP